MMRVSIAVSSSSSESSCGTRPRRARIFGPSLAGSKPRTRNSPSVAGEMHETIFMVEVLPAPFGPRKPKLSPARISKSIPSTAVNVPNRFTRSRATTKGFRWEGSNTRATLSAGVFHQTTIELLSATYSVGFRPRGAGVTNVVGELPVDDLAFHVEQRGIDFIPESERWATPRAV